MELDLDWTELKKWVLPTLGSIIAVYLFYKVLRMLRADCDLTLLNMRLKPGYFAGKVVWVTGASSGSRSHTSYHAYTTIKSSRTLYINMFSCKINNKIFLSEGGYIEQWGATLVKIFLHFSKVQQFSRNCFGTIIIIT